MGMRIVSAGKSKYHIAALENFERAMRCSDKAGLCDDWQQVVAYVRAEHSCKTGFMPGFEKITGGTEPEPDDAPSFLEGAKAR